MHGGRLATVFSARNYCASHENVSLVCCYARHDRDPITRLQDGALALFALDEVGRLQCRFKTLAHVKTQPKHDHDDHGREKKKHKHHSHHHQESHV